RGSFTVLSPKWLAGRFKMNRLLKLINFDRSHETLSRLERVTTLELQLRPLRHELDRLIARFEGHQLAPELLLVGGIDRAASQLLDLLRPLLELMPGVCACPLRAEAESALRTGQLHPYARFIDRYRGGVRICEARSSSAEHLR